MTPRRVLCAATIGFLALRWASACSRASGADPARAPAPSTRRPAVFISLDGVRADYLAAVERAGLFPSRSGFARLLEGSLRADAAHPVQNTQTAPSHVSIITCAPPSVHGVVANSFLVGGREVSGFHQEIAAETLWEAAARQGWRVLNVGYVGVDGRGPRRSVEAGIAFPDEALFGKPLLVTWRLASLPVASSWTLPASWKGQPVLLDRTREAAVDVVLDKSTGEVTRLAMLILLPTESNPGAIVFDADKNPTNGVQGELALEAAPRFVDLFAIEEDARSPLRGYKRRAFGRVLAFENQVVTFSLSAFSYNLAHPESFRRLLDARDIVWPAQHLQLDALPGKSAAPADVLAAEVLLNETMVDAALAAMAAYPFDLLLLYLPLMDSIGHRLQALVPEPFDPRRDDPGTVTYVKTFQALDLMLSRVLQVIPPDSVTAVMSDHGMSAVERAVNVGALSKELNGSFIPEGGTGLWYAKSEARRGDGAKLAAALRALEWQGASVLERARSKADATQAQQRWDYGEADWVYWLRPGLRFMMAGDAPALTATLSSGAHGYSPEEPSMNAIFALRGPGVPARRIAAMSLLDAVPSFAKAAGLAPPRQCEGKPLF